MTTIWNKSKEALIALHRAPEPEPVEEPLPDPRPVPEDDPVPPDHNPSV
jgi:hypothetical protein